MRPLGYEAVGAPALLLCTPALIQPQPHSTNVPRVDPRKHGSAPEVLHGGPGGGNAASFSLCWNHTKPWTVGGVITGITRIFGDETKDRFLRPALMSHERLPLYRGRGDESSTQVGKIS